MNDLDQFVKSLKISSPRFLEYSLCIGVCCVRTVDVFIILSTGMVPVSTNWKLSDTWIGDVLIDTLKDKEIELVVGVESALKKYKVNLF